MNILDVSQFSAITVICFIICQGVKATALNDKWIPSIAGITGIVLGILAFFVVPDFPAKDAFTAAAIGGMSGLVSTGTHQVVKQLIPIKMEDA